MRLGFHYHVPACETGGVILMPSYQARFLDAVANHCTQLVCYLHLPLPHEMAQMDSRLEAQNVALRSLGPHDPVPLRLASWPRWRRALKDTPSALDALILRGPSPLLPLLARCAWPTRTCLLIVGDALEACASNHASPLKALLMRAFWAWNQSAEMRVAERSLVFVNNPGLEGRFRARALRVYRTTTTTLTSADTYLRDTTCLGAHVKLLFVGRVVRQKGLLGIVRALSLLRLDGISASLDIVGPAADGDAFAQELRALADRLGVADHVQFHGSVPAGPALYTFYRKADIFVTASEASEGFPRTIWEAMAHSLPVVATAVGSIPAQVPGAVELCEPGSPESLRDALLRLVHNDNQRRKNILRGRELARCAVLEYQVAQMVNVLRTSLEPPA